MTEVRCLFSDMPRVQEILGAWLKLGPLPTLFEVQEIAGRWEIRVERQGRRRAGLTMVEWKWREAPAAGIAEKLMELLDRA